MKKSTKKALNKWVKGALPYFVIALLTLGTVALGSLDKQNANINLSLDNFAANNYDISIDQMSELYVVADLSNTLGLASAPDVASNYIVAVTMRDSGQTVVDKLEKPNITDIDSSRGVIERVLAEGESLASLAAEYGVSVDQIRWSNGLKTANVAAGTALYIPSTPGIVYKVKSDDTAESIAERYGSTAAEIIALNDLEVSGITEGMRILIKDGTLPERERPEYVAPAPRPVYTYTYLGDTSERTNLVCRRDLGAGQCTTWAWAKRPDLQPYTRANAKYWASMASASGFPVNNRPAPGSVFQSPSGWYGHVGYVESVNGDGSINVSERNYAGCYGVLYSTIPAGTAGKFNYIHYR